MLPFGLQSRPDSRMTPNQQYGDRTAIYFCLNLTEPKRGVIRLTFCYMSETEPRLTQSTWNRCWTVSNCHDMMYFWLKRARTNQDRTAWWTGEDTPTYQTVTSQVTTATVVAPRSSAEHWELIDSWRLQHHSLRLASKWWCIILFYIGSTVGEKDFISPRHFHW